MKSRLTITLLLLGATAVNAQVASHAPTAALNTAPAHNMTAPAKGAAPQPATDPFKPVAKVNGSVLTEIDLTREMYMMFPYANQHNGSIPKAMEPEVRKGAMEMLIFEELLYQEAKRRNVQVSPEKLAKAQAEFKKQFPSPAVYQQYLKLEFHGSQQEATEKIRRSLLIEQMLKTEVNQKAQVTPAQVRAYYDKNPKQFEHGETFAIQTISIIAPEGADKKILAEAQAKIKDALRLAKQTKSAEEFGKLAEQISDDDWRVQMGNRGTVAASNLPPDVAKAARAMQTGQVSDIIQFGRAWVIFRLNAHTPAGKTSFADASKQLTVDLQKQKAEERRAELHQQLRKNAKVEVL